MKKVIILIMSIILATWTYTWAQVDDDPFDPITKAFRESDSRSLAASFNITVEIHLPDYENTYSSSQAEMIMKDFFKKCPVDSFDIIKKGTTDAVSKFAIGNYISGAQRFQVYIHLRKEKDKYLIQKINFDEQK